MKLYHYTSRTNMHQILIEGLKPGSEVEQGEKLPFVMLSKTPGNVKVGNAVYFEIEINNDDPVLKSVNDDWFEYYGEISPWSIVAMANPPANTDALIELVQNHGTMSQEYRNVFKFVTIPKIYNSWEEEFVPKIDFDFYSTTPSVYKIIIDRKDRLFDRWQACAIFRTNDTLENIACNGDIHEEALNKLISHLKSHYTE